MAVHGRDRPRIAQAQLVELPHLVHAVRGVQLVHHEEYGLGRLAQDARNGLVVGVDPGLAVHEEQDDVRLVRAGQRLIADGALEGVVVAHLDAAGPVGLMVGAVARDAAHLVDDGLVGLGYAVDEGGLADVRPSDHRDDG